MSDKETAAANANPLRPATCKSPRCGKPIYWLPLNGRLHPFDDPEGKVSHFSSCVDAKKFRRR